LNKRFLISKLNLITQFSEKMDHASNNIKYVFVGKIEQSQTLAEVYIKKKDEKVHEECKKIFQGVAKLSENSYEQRNKIGSGDNVYFFIVKTTDEGPMFFFLEAKNSYPDRQAFHFIDELVSERIISASKSEHIMKDEIKRMIEKYQFTSEPLDNVISDVNDIKVEVNRSIQSQLKNLQDVNELKGKSENIKLGAEIYKKDARDLERLTCMQNWKWRIIIFLVFCLLVLVIVIPIVLTKKEDSSSSGSNTPGSGTVTPVNVNNSTTPTS
jgi:hypothetical protein